MLSGQRVPQYPDAALAANTHRFNVMVGARIDRFPGFTVLNCFGAGVPDDRELCLFVRPGGCD